MGVLHLPPWMRVVGFNFSSSVIIQTLLRDTVPAPPQGRTFYSRSIAPALNLSDVLSLTDIGFGTVAPQPTSPVPLIIANSLKWSFDGSNSFINIKSLYQFSVGDVVSISGATPTGYNGTYTVLAVVTDPQFAGGNVLAMYAPGGGPLQTVMGPWDYLSLRAFIAALWGIDFANSILNGSTPTFDAKYPESLNSDPLRPTWHWVIGRAIDYTPTYITIPPSIMGEVVLGGAVSSISLTDGMQGVINIEGTHQGQVGITQTVTVTGNNTSVSKTGSMSAITTTTTSGGLEWTYTSGYKFNYFPVPRAFVGWTNDPYSPLAIEGQYLDREFVFIDGECVGRPTTSNLTYTLVGDDPDFAITNVVPTLKDDSDTLIQQIKVGLIPTPQSPITFPQQQAGKLLGIVIFAGIQNGQSLGFLEGPPLQETGVTQTEIYGTATYQSREDGSAQFIGWTDAAPHYEVLGATLISAGKSGTPGTATLTGTTGVGTLFQVSVTINNGGGIASIDSVVSSGSYTTKPTDIAKEPVTGGGLIGAVLSLAVRTINAPTGKTVGTGITNGSAVIDLTECTYFVVSGFAVISAGSGGVPFSTVTMTAVTTGMVETVWGITGPTLTIGGAPLQVTVVLGPTGGVSGVVDVLNWGDYMNPPNWNRNTIYNDGTLLAYDSLSGGGVSGAVLQFTMWRVIPAECYYKFTGITGVTRSQQPALTTFAKKVLSYLTIIQPSNCYEAANAIDAINAVITH